jgi:hypothetical protein
LPNRNYNRGRAFEYARKKAWEKVGYIVLRTAGSHGDFDLVAVRSGHVTFIQCKLTDDPTVAARLKKAFVAHPPFQSSRHFHQCLEVKIRGGKVDQAFV